MGIKIKCNGCYAAITTKGHPRCGECVGCELGHKTNGKGIPMEECPKPKSWKELRRLKNEINRCASK